jgi:hypothetical protein
MENLGPQVAEVYAEFGLAMSVAQLLERQLVSLVIAAYEPPLGKLTADEYDGLLANLSKHTLGTLIQKLRKSFDVPAGFDLRLEEALRLRNWLTHHYFADRAAEFQSPEGRSEMIRELDGISDRLNELDMYFDHLLVNWLVEPSMRTRKLIIDVLAQSQGAMRCVEEQNVAKALEGEAELHSASMADAVVPKAPGFYSIFVDRPDNLPEPFAAYLRSCGTTLLYIGRASTSLFQRLVEEDFRHQGPSTFFRSIGAILGYRPQPGSLVGKLNQDNYRFSPIDTEKIAEWIKQHLAIRFVEADISKYPGAERDAIQRNCPILNTIHNPKCFPLLDELRSECRATARQNTAQTPLDVDVCLFGIDCAVEDAKTGLARGRLTTTGVIVGEAMQCGRDRKAIDIIVNWIEQERTTPTLLAIDAPLGWPEPLTITLRDHNAGEEIFTEANTMFRRHTDRFVKERIGKCPLDVGADRIARTAHAALTFLGELRRRLRHGIPLAWLPGQCDPISAIEVYPAATLLAHSIRTGPYKKPKNRAERKVIIDSLQLLLHFPQDTSALQESANALDAVVCLLAGADFLRGQAMLPTDQALVKKEGWIWVCPLPKGAG